MMTKRKGKALLSLLLALIMALGMAAPASAVAISDSAISAVSDSWISVQKQDSYTKNGKFYMPFRIKIGYTPDQAVVTFTARLLNSDGKEVLIWNKGTSFSASSEQVHSWYADYSKLPSGKYTFQLIASDSYFDTFRWNYTINHNTSKIAIKSFQTITDTQGNQRMKLNIQCTNIKGKALTYQVFNSSGKEIYKYTGKQRKTNNEVGWWAWNYYPSDGGLKCTSGKYTIKVSAPGVTPIQKTYDLKIPA